MKRLLCTEYLERAVAQSQQSNRQWLLQRKVAVSPDWKVTGIGAGKRAEEGKRNESK